MVINIKAAKITKDTIQPIVLDPMKKLVSANMPPPIMRPNPSIPKGAKLPLVTRAINPMIRKTPEVMPNANPIIFQSTNIVNAENNNPTNNE